MKLEEIFEKLEKIGVLKAHTIDDVRKTETNIGITTINKEDYIGIQCPECHKWLYIPIGYIKGLFVLQRKPRGVV